MFSRVIPLEYLRERDVMFWLPPGGQDNEVWACTWVILADVDPADAKSILAALRDADVGAYIASPSGLKGAVSPTRQLYVDREQHNLATDVVMQCLRKKDQPPVPRAERIAPKVRSTLKIPAVPRPVSIALQVVFVAALIAGALALVYLRGPSMFPGVHGGHHPAQNSNVPGMTHPSADLDRP